MIRYRNVPICFSLGFAIFAYSCSTSTTNYSEQKTLEAKLKAQSSSAEINKALATIALTSVAVSADYHIGPDDLVQITLYNITVTDSGLTPRTVTLRVSQQGIVSLPLIGEVKVSGLTSSGLERELQRQYEKYIYNPQVGVLVTEYRQRVSVIGAVLKPGVYELSGPKTVIDLLALAGGVTDRAGTQVHIYRQGSNGPEIQVIDLLVLASNASLLDANNASLLAMPVQGGDIINVPAAGMFFVDGAVRSPGSYPLGRRYSLTQALAIAGGINVDLSSSDITIFRRKSTSGVEPITVDVEAIYAGSATDPQIEADDMILVPINGFKYVYQKVFGQVLSWGISAAGVAAMSGS